MIVIRIAIALVLLVSGFEKALAPYQNFLYTLQAYQLPIPYEIETLIAQIFPWVELLIGAFLLVGFRTVLALKGAAVLFAGFIIIVGQALLRNIPLENCGCFGELIHLPPHLIIVIDSLVLLAILLMFTRLKSTQRFSLDNRFTE